MESAMESDKDKEKKNGESPAIAERLLESRTIIVSGPVDSEMATRVMTQLVLLSHIDPKKRVTLLVNCPGGEVFSGFAIFDMIRYMGCPVISVVAGLAASMGTIIPLAAGKGNRYALPHAKFLIHQPLLMGYQGKASDLEIQANEIIKDRERIAKLYADLTGKPEKEVMHDIDRDKWMSAEEAVEYGLIDKIVASKAELPG
jgi:ATP-dependent Clp protease protease subunit